MAEQILDLFPLQELPPQEPEGSKIERSVERLKQVQNRLTVQTPRPVEDEDEGENDDNEAVNRPGELYRRYRTIEELPDNAKAFYELAGKFVLDFS